MNSKRWAAHNTEFDAVFQPPSFQDFLTEVKRGDVETSPGITGIGYGHLRAFPEQLQRLFHAAGDRAGGGA
jgi:hypothetical protein